MQKAKRIAVDVGGTFTDFMIFDESDGLIQTGKVASTPDNPMIGVINGIKALNVNLKEIHTFNHGTTVATNALITRDYKKTAMITTEGFRDVLEIRDGTKDELWDAYIDIQSPLIRRRYRYEIKERVNYAGEVVADLDEQAARELAVKIKNLDIESVAICFINSFLNPVNEDLMAKILQEECPGIFITRSAAVLPEMFEYPRFNTAAANACLAPKVTDYVTNLGQAIIEDGYEGDLLILHSGGGTMTAQQVSDFPVRLAGSGIAAGAMAAQTIGKMCNCPNAIGLDMGGTSTDVSLIYDGKLRTTKEWSITYGFPITFPSIEIVTIGAGGGSIAWQDSAGILHNGPQSAGAVPGPVCYDTGGTQVTNTDANLVLGRLGTNLAGGVLQVNLDAAKKALQELGKKLDMDTEQAAASVLRIANANLADAVRLISTRRGYDPREFALVAFGGAGALHAAFVARELSIPKVVVPLHPGVNSAFGCLLGDITHDFARMYQKTISDVDAVEIKSIYADMIKEGKELLRRAGIEDKDIKIEQMASMRYEGQWRSLVVPIDSDDMDLKQAEVEFHKLHKQEFSYERNDINVEVYQLSIKIIGLVKSPDLRSYPVQYDWQAKPVSHRDVWFEDEGWLSTPIYDRADLVSGAKFDGPAIIEQLDATTVVPPWTQVEVEPRLNMVISIKGVSND